jgi:hypothetical protein
MVKRSGSKRKCSRGNKRGSVIVKSHMSKGKKIPCYRRKKASKSKKNN